MRSVFLKYREVRERDALTEYRLRRLMHSISQSFSSKRVKKPPIPDILKGRVRDC